MAISEAPEVRVPPQNLEAEQSVLGAILLDNSALNRAMEILSEEDFYRTGNRVVYRGMVALSERNQPVDQITLTDYLRGTGELDQIGGASYIAEIVQVVPSAANIRYHSNIVRDKSLLRGLVRTATEVAMRGYEGMTGTNELLEFAEREIFRLAQGHLGGTFAPLSNILHESIEIVDRLYSRKERITGVPTGFTDLDNLLAGLQPSDLIIVAGRPSMGKTSLALGMAEYSALKANAIVGIFSLEMSKAQLVLRMISSQAMLDSHAVRTGQLRQSDWGALTAAASQLEQAKIFIDDSGNLTVQQMRGKARRLKAEHGLSLLIVDYLQLMEGRGNAESRQQEISDISRALKGLAKELNIPVIALSQLSRAVENRTDKRPMLADLRESGAIEQDADVVMFIYRDEVYNPDSEDKGIAEILVRKHRNGPIGEVDLQFHDRYAKFNDLTRVRQAGIV
ncbi:MAG: replicative DNA helicase [Nitrospirales bacterium]|nr:replicative DNA helicase [Nitrospira sp.]MDR4459706.1 replicative DNA helicase [Nitrospirales bacterium]